MVPHTKEKEEEELAPRTTEDGDAVIDYAFSTEAAVMDQAGEWISLFAHHTVAVRATKTEYGPPDEEGYRKILHRKRAVRIMAPGYLAIHGHPKDNPQELTRIEYELKAQLHNNVPVWMEDKCPEG